MLYEKLFTPGRIASLELKNRIVMPAMGCSLAESTGEAGPGSFAITPSARKAEQV